MIEPLPRLIERRPNRHRSPQRRNDEQPGSQPHERQTGQGSPRVNRGPIRTVIFCKGAAGNLGFEQTTEPASIVPFAAIIGIRGPKNAKALVLGYPIQTPVA